MTQNISLIWLDRKINENTPNYQKTIKQLRQTINSLNTFTDEKACVEFLKNIGNNKQVCMIISGSLGQHIVPQIHNLSQLDTIFIFCANKQFHETWAKNYSKIKGIFSEIPSICEALRKIVRQYEQNSISMSFVKTIGASSKDKIEPSFMYSTILKEILLTIEFKDQQIEEFINSCRETFKDNDQELENVNKFQRERTQISPVWWYTYECFLYPMLNRGLRLLDGDIIIKMGFFVADLHRQIEKLYKQQSANGQLKNQFIAYRGQGMTKTEFAKLQQTKGGLISFNNFLSTSKKREVSMRFALTSVINPENIGVLFVMTIQPGQSTTPFASIAELSYYGPEEDEVLFGMHSIFRINDIRPMNDNSGIFEVDLRLTTDNDKDLQKLTQQIRQESYPECRGWYRLAIVLGNMGQFKEAQQIYEILLQEETMDVKKASIYNQLGLMKYKQGEYKEAISYYEKNLEMSKKLLSPNDPHFASCYCNMGNVYLQTGEYTKALSNFEKSLAIAKQLRPPDYPRLATCYNNIGNVYLKMDNYIMVISNYEKALAIRQQSLPPNHPDLAQSYSNIGAVYSRMGEYVKALSNYEKALAIWQQSLPPNHPNLAMAYNNIGSGYGNIGEYVQAVSYFEKALAIWQQSLPPDHPDVKKIKDNLERVKKEM